jgi:hypothetical protein
MKREIGFGCTVIGNYTAIKINMKLDESQINSLKEKYKDWLSFIDNGKFGVKITGVLLHESVAQFFKDTRRAKLISNLLKISEEIKAIDGDTYMEFHEGDNYVECWTKANLDEI